MTTSTGSFEAQFLAEVREIAETLSMTQISHIVMELRSLRDRGGRLFILGVGGSAANASHAVNDFRKLCDIEAYTPIDNVSELSARTNDEGWDSTFVSYLKGSRLAERDAVLVLSVGGGSVERHISANLVLAVRHASTVKARILGIVGRDGGYTATVAHACVIIPLVNPHHVTPHSEAFQSVLLHLIVSHPLLQVHTAKWEASTR